MLYRFHVLRAWGPHHIDFAERLDTDLDVDVARARRQSDRRAAVLNAGGEVR